MTRDETRKVARAKKLQAKAVAVFEARAEDAARAAAWVKRMSPRTFLAVVTKRKGKR